MSNLCLCDGGKPFKKCCERFLNGNQIAKTPKQLMRSRYTAYALGGYGDYLFSTWLSETRQGLTTETLSEKTIGWIKLEVLNSSQKGDEGFVEFKAYYKDEAGQEKVHHEKSTFKRIDRKWYYEKGEVELNN